MGDIGVERREVEFEPLPQPEPARQVPAGPPPPPAREPVPPARTPAAAPA